MENLKNEHVSSAEIEESVGFRDNFQDKQQQQPQQQQKQRRTKIDHHKRAHACGCGKSYLSAAALYTHVKQKHEGIHQTATSQVPVKSNNNKKDSSQSTGQNKGRTHRMADLNAASVYSDISQFFMKNIKDSSQFSKIENSLEPYDWILDVFPRHFFKNGTDYFGVLQQLESLINQLKTQNQLSSTVNQENTDKSDTPSNGKQLTNDTASEKDSTFHQKRMDEKANNRKKDQSDEQFAFSPCNYSIVGAEKEEDNDMSIVDVYDFTRDLRITSINRIISIFIINVSKLISPSGFTEILVFLTLFRKSLNEKADDICSSPLPQVQQNLLGQKQSKLNKECTFEDEEQLKSPSELKKQVKIEEEHLQLEESEEKTQKIGESSEFCSQNSGELIAEFANTFVTDFLPGYFENSVANVNELNLLGPHEEGMKNAYYILQLFINWMYVFKFSSSRVSFFEEQEEQQEIIPFKNEIQGRKQQKYEYDILQSLENESRNNYYNTSMSHHLQTCLQKSSLNFLDRIQSADNLDEQQDPSGIQSGVIQSFDDGTLFEKVSHQQDTSACFMGSRSAMTSTTFGRFHGSTCNSTSYAQGGNSMTFFNQNTPLSTIGSTCFNINGQKILHDPSSPRIPSLSFTNSLFDQGYLGNVMLGQQSNYSSFPMINKAQFITSTPASFYGSAYGQQLACQIQQAQQQYYYPQISWNQSYLAQGGNERF